jgi:DnaJ-class molecular chaperone
MRDPYSVLGVKRNADADEIKAAWRSKAKTVHPDANQDDPSATTRFAEVGQAYEVLKDPERRKRYDHAAEMHQTIMEQRSAARQAAERAKAAKANAEKVMEELARANAQRAQAQAQGQAKAQSATSGTAQSAPGAETPEDMIDRIFGAGTSEQAKAQSKTPDGEAEQVRGDAPSEKPPLPLLGVELIASLLRRFRSPAAVPEKAPDIFAEATVTVEDLLKQNWVTHKLPDEREVRFALEKGMGDGHVLRLKGQGLKVNGMKPGDLVVTIKAARDAKIRIEGFNLHTSLPISLEDAVLGAETTIETPEGPRAVTVAPWSGSDQTIKLEGLGLHTDTGGRGDLIVELRVVLWEKPNEKVTDLMRHMRHGLYV